MKNPKESTPNGEKKKISNKQRQRKGRYYLLKTRDYLKNLGYEVDIVEKTQRIVTKDDKGKQFVLFQKKDLWGADLVARNREELIWVQVKSNKGDIGRGIKQLSEDENWPDSDVVKRWVMCWEPRVREPEIVEVIIAEQTLEDDELSSDPNVSD
tara:strand:+ start:42 stop:503 length:462 start_codon:yes stop_codon:yes gene_type:complete